MQATCIMYRSANICFQLICDKRSFRYNFFKKNKFKDGDLHFLCIRICEK